MPSAPSATATSPTSSTTPRDTGAPHQDTRLLSLFMARASACVVSRPIWTEVVSQQLYDYELDWHETTNLATNSSYDRMMAELLAQMKEGFEE